MLFNFKVAVFDLDFTLWNCQELYEQTQSILANLSSKGIRLYVASFHLDAERQCESLGINKYFSSILYGRDVPKSQMIRRVMDDAKVSPSDVVFFDDSFDNVLEVQSKHQIRAIQVDRTNGITWIDILRSNRPISTQPGQKKLFHFMY